MTSMFPACDCILQSINYYSTLFIVMLVWNDVISHAFHLLSLLSNSLSLSSSSSLSLSNSLSNSLPLPLPNSLPLSLSNSLSLTINQSITHRNILSILFRTKCSGRSSAVYSLHLPFMLLDECN